jgi:hypothetical protein
MWNANTDIDMSISREIAISIISIETWIVDDINRFYTKMDDSFTSPMSLSYNLDQGQ